MDPVGTPAMTPAPTATDAPQASTPDVAAAPAEPTSPPEAVEAARVAFEGLLGRLLGAQAGSATADADYLAGRALELVAIARGAAAAKLQLVPEALFSAATIGELEAVALSIQHLGRLQRSASEAAKDEGPRGSVIADKLLEEAEGVRATLHKLLDYHFGDDATVAAELAEFRGRRGALRIAVTLARLGAMAKEREGFLAKDTKYWREGLSADAERIAAEIQASAGAISDKDAKELERRALSLIEAPFADLRATLAWLLRADPTAVDALPTLKKPSVRKKAEPASA